MPATNAATCTRPVQPAADPDGLFDAATYLAAMNATLAPPGVTPHDVAPVIAASGESVMSWLWRRVSLLEGQRQTLHRERDEARNVLAAAKDVINSQALTIGRLRAHLAAAGRNLDELTAPVTGTGDAHDDETEECR